MFSVAGNDVLRVDTGDSARLRFKVEDERFLEPTERPGVIPAPDLARARWVSVVEPRALAEAELHALLRRSYELVRAKLPRVEQRRLGME